jgi:hypothetical protein
MTRLCCISANSIHVLYAHVESRKDRFEADQWQDCLVGLLGLYRVLIGVAH